MRNKYVLTTLFLIVWLLFFDKNDLFSQLELTGQLNDLKKEEQYYIFETSENKRKLSELKTNSSSLEKFAREEYLMKKNDEEIFVIVKK